MLEEKPKKLLKKIQMILPFNNKEEGEKKNKRKIENLVVFIVILVITVIFINSIWNDNKAKEKKKEENSEKTLATINSNEKGKNEQVGYTLEEKLEKILESIEGVRKSKRIAYIFRK